MKSFGVACLLAGIIVLGLGIAAFIPPFLAFGGLLLLVGVLSLKGK